MKNMNRSTLCLASVLAVSVLCAGVAVAVPLERAAVVYSGYSGGSFSTEYDAHLKKVGVAFDKYENVRLPGRQRV